MNNLKSQMCQNYKIDYQKKSVYHGYFTNNDLIGLV